jgi:predicted transcriptional regulator
VTRLSIKLDAEHAQKLARIAERMHVQPGTVARSLLSTALDEAEPDALTMVQQLDGIEGAFERAQIGLAQARSGETVPLDEL